MTIPLAEKDEKARHAEYCSLKDQICFYHLRMPPLSDPCGLRPSESVSTLNPHLLVAHTTLYGSGMILHSLRSDTNSEARGHMLACARRLLEICEKIRGHARLFKVQTALMPMLHMMNAIRVVARELRASVVRGDATQCADYCLAIESALDFLDDVTTSYPAWVDVPIALKDTLLSAARTLPH
ncbi:hypothetical protein DL93DRAFT_64140 [Clavulina sp. PMI_390]|nr:hypothetical protein DL93DRAFT_64140 [Clavulina sp. PMI_390]